MCTVIILKFTNVICFLFSSFHKLSCVHLPLCCGLPSLSFFPSLPLNILQPHPIIISLTWASSTATPTCRTPIFLLLWCPCLIPLLSRARPPWSSYITSSSTSICLCARRCPLDITCWGFLFSRFLGVLARVCWLGFVDFLCLSVCVWVLFSFFLS